MSLAELQRLALINAELVQKGKPLQSYGLPSGQASEYAGLEGLFSSAQSAGSSSFFRDTIGGAVSGLTSLIKTGTEAGNYVGKQVGLPNLGSNLYTFLTPGSFLPDVLSRATTGKTLAEQLSSLGQNVAKDTSSTAYQVGNILGQAGTAILGTGAVSAGLKGLGIGAKAINAAGFTTTAADIGAGTAIGGALQAAGDWEQFDKSNGQPGAKMSGAEFLTRMGMGMITGGLSAPLNPRWGKLANIGFDALVGGATQGALEGAGYLAANKARQEEIEKTYKSNIATSAAINAAIGAGARGVQALLTPKPAAAEPVAPAAPATPVAALPAAQGVTPTAPTTINPLDQFKANISEWAKTTPPNEVNIIAQQLGAKDGSAQSLIERVDQIVEDMDPSGENIAGTLEWLDKQFGTQWHPKGTGQVLPVQPVAGAEQPQVSAEEAAERAAIQEESAPFQYAPPTERASQALVPKIELSQPPGLKLPAVDVAKGQGIDITPPELLRSSIQIAEAHYVATRKMSTYLEQLPQDVVSKIAANVKARKATPASIVTKLQSDAAGYDPAQTGAGLQWMERTFNSLVSQVPTVKESERLVSTPPTPEPVPSPIQGEPNVQPRPEDVNVSEPGQPEPIAGEPPVQAVEPSEVQQAEAIPPTGAEGQAPEEVTTPITEPIAGEPNATQEGQVTEGGQPEYLGVPQGEDVQENVPEVRQEEGERPSDSSSPVEGGQEQAQYFRGSLSTKEKVALGGYAGLPDSLVKSSNPELDDPVGSVPDTGVRRSLINRAAEFVNNAYNYLDGFHVSRNVMATVRDPIRARQDLVQLLSGEPLIKPVVGKENPLTDVWNVISAGKLPPLPTLTDLRRDSREKVRNNVWGKGEQEVYVRRRTKLAIKYIYLDDAEQAARIPVALVTWYQRGHEYAGNPPEETLVSLILSPDVLTRFSSRRIAAEPMPPQLLSDAQSSGTSEQQQLDLSSSSVVADNSLSRQAKSTPANNNDPVITVAGSELYNEFVGDIELDNPESLVDQYLRDGSITDFPNATSDQIARAEEIVETNLNGRKIQDLASMIIDQENTLSSESEKMASSIQKFLIGDTTGSHTLEMSVAGAQNPLRNLIGIIADYTGADAPDMRRMKKDAQATMLDDGVMRSDYVFEKDGVPVASMTYYKEPGNKRAIIILEPSKELQAAIRLQQSEVINRTMEDQYGVSSDIGEMFAETETGISPAEVAQLDVQQTRDKRQLPYQENVESRSQMQQIYQEQIKEYANTYDVPVETFDAAVVAASNAEAESGRPGDIFQTDAWQSYVDGLQDPEQVAIAEDHNYRTDVREALAFKRQIEMATQTVAGPAKPRRTKRSKPEQKGFDFNEGAAKASLGILPAIAAPTLEDDKEYFPGVNGATLKGLLFAVGGGAFMVHHISKKPIMHVGAEITGLTTQRTTWMQSLRNRMVGVRDRITGSDAKKLQHATIEHNARIYGEAMNLSEEQIKELAAKNIKDNDALESMPSMFGLGGVTSLSILGKQTGNALPGRLAEAAYAGRAIGEKRSIAINLAQKAFKSLPEDRQVALGQLLIDIDYATTNRINAEQIMSTENRWTPKAATLRDLCKQEIENVLKKTAAQNPSAWPQLEQDYRMLDPIYDDARRAYFEMVAFEQAGVESIDSGFKSYGKKIDQLEKVKAGALEQLQSAQAKGASLEEIKAITSAIEGINNQVIMAMKMRNVIGDLRNARDMSVVRKYIPRWFDVDRHEFRIRIKETATDIGLVQSFKDEAGMTRFLEMMNKQLTDEDRKLNGIPATHPQTGRDINTFSDFYRSQGGSVEVVVNKQKITKIIEHTADQMALREALEALQDSVADGGGITADRFKRFFEAYGSDLSNMITAKELDDIGISGREIDKLVAANSRVSTAQIRRLINAVAVPRMTDVTMHRANVLGYAPERINNLTKEVNPLFSRDMVDFIDNGFNFFLARTKSRAESASLRREINSQIIDLTARGIAPTYVDRIASIGSGLRWKPTTMTTALGKEILLSRFDRKIAAFGAFKMMGGNVPSAVKNVFMGFINTATQLSSETDGSLAKAMSLGYKGEAAYWQMLAKDRSMRKEMAAHLRSPDSLQTIDEQINRAIKSNDAARAVWILARESGAFDAVFYKNLERVLNPETISKSKIAQKIVDIAALPQVLAEHHNRGASFMTGAMAHLQQFPADVEGAFAKGLQFQGMTQGNFNNYNKSALERKLLELPFGRSFLLLSNAALRSNEQLGAHFVAAAMRPTHSKIWVPLLAYAGTSMVFTGLVGAPIAGDVYKTVNFIADLFEKDDDELKAIKESPLEALQRKAGESAAAMGFSQELGEWVFKNISIGTSSVLTGKNFSTENTIINFATQWPPPGISAPLAAFDYFRNFGDMQTPAAMVIGGTSAFNAELGRIFRGFEQVRVGGKLGKSGDQVSTGYDLKNYVGDVLFGSDLDDALYGTSKRGGGGKIYFADQANAYMKTIDNISGIKLDQRLHKDPFFVKTEGLPDKQAMVEAVNKFRSLNIVNYDALAEQRQRTLDIWNGIASDPEKRNVLVRIAMEGQQGSRQSDPGAWIDGAGDKIKSYYLGLAVQRSYSQMGIPPPEFKYQEADPMFPVWKYIADKAKRGGIMIAPE